MKKCIFINIVAVVLLLASCGQSPSTAPSIFQDQSSSSQMETTEPESTLSSCRSENVTSADSTSGDTSSSQTNTKETLPFTYYLSYSQNSSINHMLNENPIDKSFLQDEEKHSTQSEIFSVVDEENFISKYYTIWSKEQETVLKKLRSKLSGKALKALNDSQINWEKLFKSEPDLQDEVYFSAMGEGTDRSILTGYKQIGLVRYRTLELAEFYCMFTGSYSFEFHT